MSEHVKWCSCPPLRCEKRDDGWCHLPTHLREAIDQSAVKGTEMSDPTKWEPDADSGVIEFATPEDAKKAAALFKQLSDEINRLRADIAKATANHAADVSGDVSRSDWQPMTTAPKDGTRILSFRKDIAEALIVRWGTSEPFGDEKEWTTDSEGPGYSSGFNEDELLGWQSLPSQSTQGNGLKLIMAVTDAGGAQHSIMGDDFAAGALGDVFAKLNRYETAAMKGKGN